MPPSCWFNAAGSTALRSVGFGAAASRVRALISRTAKRTVSTPKPAALMCATISFTSSDSSWAQLAEAA
ncbi:MAG: hypothetical protein ABI488_04715 [Polyangiaceae bacterium]